MRKLVATLSALTICVSSFAAGDPAQRLARIIAERDANEGRVGTMHFRLTNASGAVRNRKALMIHSQDDATTRIGIFFEAPAMIADTAFLSFDHAADQDENWLFLPATERVRRLPISERGDYFLGTDLTYGDIKDNFKFALDEWQFATADDAAFEGKTYPVLLGQAGSDAVATEVGYASFRALVDETTGFPVVIEYADTRGEPLKRVEVHELDQIGGVWTAMRFVVRHLQSGHSTEVHFTDMRHVPDLDESVLDPGNLMFGSPDVG